MIGKEGIALRLVSLFIIWMGRTTLTWSLGMKLGTFRLWRDGSYLQRMPTYDRQSGNRINPPKPLFGMECIVLCIGMEKSNNQDMDLVST